MDKDKSFKKKGSLYYSMILLFIVILCLFLITITLFYRYSKKELEKEYARSSTLIATQVAGNIRSLLTAVERKNLSSANLMRDFGELLSLVSLADVSDHRINNDYIELTNKMETYQSLMVKAHWIAIMDTQNRVYLNSTAKHRGVTADQVEQWVLASWKRLTEPYGKTVYVKGYSDTIIGIRAVFDEKTLRFPGFFIAGFDPTLFTSIFETVKNDHGDFLVFDSEGELMFCSRGTKNSYKVLSSVEELDEKRYVTTMQDIGDSGLKLVHLLDLELVNKRYQSVLWFTLALGITVCLLATAVIFFTIRKLESNLQNILLHIGRISQGDFTKREAVGLSSEMQIVSNGLDSMSDQIQMLMVQALKNEESQRQAHIQLLQAQYKALQTQVNPHFLYNVLETINGLAAINGDSQTSEIICNLARFFRRNLNRIEQFYPLQEEFFYIQDYLTLYQSIYMDRLKVEFHIQKETKEVLIPTFLLQPLVENSIVHGMEKKMGVCTIQVGTSIKDGTLNLYVEDDGLGMTPEKLAEISVENDLLQGNRVGLNNIRKRLTLLYGDLASIHIKSEPYVATRVDIYLPVEYAKGEPCTL